MIDANPRLIFFVLFTAGLAAFLWLDREKVQRHFIIFYRRTQRGISFIDRTAKRFPRFWNAYGWAGVLTGIISIFGSLALVGYTFFDIFQTQSLQNGPSLILPGIVAENQFNPGVSFIPVEYWIASIAVLMIVHEFSHGIVARAEDFELNSVGWGIMGIFPIAFVEPKGEGMLPGADVDEDVEGHWHQGNWKQRIKVLCAGSFANYLTAALFLGGSLAFTAFLTVPSGVFYDAQQGYPAMDAGMDNGTINQINGQDIETLEDLENAASDLEVNDTVNIWSSEGNFTFQTVNKEGEQGGYMGVNIGQTQVMKSAYSGYSGILNWFNNLLLTVGFLNFLIGMFNMLPLKPLDGGWTVDAVLEKFAGEGSRSVLDAFSILGWILLLGTMFLSLVL
ncbi:MAG: site-2 protease family protein [Nanohaloarchaea archaeon]|nr:site-2 protease family protein [Candidatus Nanohaloarchaea archaeon]